MSNVQQKDRDPSLVHARLRPTATRWTILRWWKRVGHTTWQAIRSKIHSLSYFDVCVRYSRACNTSPPLSRCVSRHAAPDLFLIVVDARNLAPPFHAIFGHAIVSNPIGVRLRRKAGPLTLLSPTQPLGSTMVKKITVATALALATATVANAECTWRA